MQKVMDKIRIFTISQQVNDALNTYNEPSIVSVHDLSINSPVLIYWEEKDGQLEEWKEPYIFLSTQNKSVIIELPNAPT